MFYPKIIAEDDNVALSTTIALLIQYSILGENVIKKV